MMRKPKHHTRDMPFPNKTKYHHSTKYHRRHWSSHFIRFVTHLRSHGGPGRFQGTPNSGETRWDPSECLHCVRTCANRAARGHTSIAHRPLRNRIPRLRRIQTSHQARTRSLRTSTTTCKTLVDAPDAAEGHRVALECANHGPVDMTAGLAGVAPRPGSRAKNPTRARLERGTRRHGVA